MPDAAAGDFEPDSQNTGAYQLGASGARLQWRRSPRCSAQTCVEIAELADGRVAVRDSNQARQSQILIFGRDEWAEFVAAIRAGELG